MDTIIKRLLRELKKCNSVAHGTEPEIHMTGTKKTETEESTNQITNNDTAVSCNRRGRDGEPAINLQVNGKMQIHTSADFGDNNSQQRRTTGHGALNLSGVAHAQ